MQISKDLMAIGRYLRRQRNRMMAPLGLKGVHARLLWHILEEPGISQDGLAQELGFDKSNVARHAAFLEEAGYLTRHSNAQDKRVLQVFPTEKTLALQPQLLDAMEQWEAQLLKHLSRDEQAALAGLLERVCRAATEEEG